MPEKSAGAARFGTAAILCSFPHGVGAFLRQDPRLSFGNPSSPVPWPCSSPDAPHLPPEWCSTRPRPTPAPPSTSPAASGCSTLLANPAGPGNAPLWASPTPSARSPNSLWFRRGSLRRIRFWRRRIPSRFGCRGSGRIAMRFRCSGGFCRGGARRRRAGRPARPRRCGREPRGSGCRRRGVRRPVWSVPFFRRGSGNTFFLKLFSCLSDLHEKSVKTESLEIPGGMVHWILSEISAPHNEVRRAYNQ